MSVDDLNSEKSIPLNALGQVESPCRSICKLDENSICEGCFRTSSEISFWVTMDNDERTKVIHKARQRQWEKEHPAV